MSRTVKLMIFCSVTIVLLGIAYSFYQSRTHNNPESDEIVVVSGSGLIEHQDKTLKTRPVHTSVSVSGTVSDWDANIKRRYPFLTVTSVSCDKRSCVVEAATNYLAIGGNDVAIGEISRKGLSAVNLGFRYYPAGEAGIEVTDDGKMNITQKFTKDGQELK